MPLEAPEGSRHEGGLSQRGDLLRVEGDHSIGVGCIMLCRLRQLLAAFFKLQSFLAGGACPEIQHPRWAFCDTQECL